jgi:hypothetical protein
MLSAYAKVHITNGVIGLIGITILLALSLLIILSMIPRLMLHKLELEIEPLIFQIPTVFFLIILVLKKQMFIQNKLKHKITHAHDIVRVVGVIGPPVIPLALVMPLLITVLPRKLPLEHNLRKQQHTRFIKHI